MLEPQIIERETTLDEGKTVEQKLQGRSSGKRIFALDAMRGLAAFVVIWYHFRFAFDMRSPRWYLQPFFAGHQAVVLFFVLSGYVLSLPYWRGRQLPYLRYLVRRVFRIYLPYAGATLVALFGASCMLDSQLPLTPWFYRTWHSPLTPHLIAHQFLMGNGGELNTAFWSLRYEMEMSIVFPFLCWLLVRLRLWGSVGFGVAIALLGIRFQSDTLTWGCCFTFGALLAWRQDSVAHLYRQAPAMLKSILLALVAWSYFSNVNLLVMLGACGALIFAQHSRASAWLDSPIPEYLGRVSYSMYLMHGTILFTVLILFYGRLPFALLVLVYFAATMAGSHLFCVLVEEPASRMGRRLTTKAAAQSGVPTVVHSGTT